MIVNEFLMFTQFPLLTRCPNTELRTIFVMLFLNQVGWYFWMLLVHLLSARPMCPATLLKVFICSDRVHAYVDLVMKMEEDGCTTFVMYTYLRTKTDRLTEGVYRTPTWVGQWISFHSTAALSL